MSVGNCHKCGFKIVECSCNSEPAVRPIAPGVFVVDVGADFDPTQEDLLKVEEVVKAKLPAGSHVIACPHGASVRQVTPAMVHIHEGLYLDAASVLSVEAQSDANGGKIVVFWNLPRNAPGRRRFDVSDHGTAVNLAVKIMDRVNAARGYPRPIIMEPGVKLTPLKVSSKELEFIDRENLKERIIKVLEKMRLHSANREDHQNRWSMTDLAKDLADELAGPSDEDVARVEKKFLENMSKIIKKECLERKRGTGRITAQPSEEGPVAGTITREKRIAGCTGVDWCPVHNTDHGHPEPPPDHFREDGSIDKETRPLQVCLGTKRFIREAVIDGKTVLVESDVDSDDMKDWSLVRRQELPAESVRVILATKCPCGSVDLKNETITEPVYASLESGLPLNMIVDYIYRGQKITCNKCGEVLESMAVPKDWVEPSSDFGGIGTVTQYEVRPPGHQFTPAFKCTGCQKTHEGTPAYQGIQSVLCAECAAK